MVARDHCTGCSACVASCPFDAVHMERDIEGFLYPMIDQGRCMHCGRCDQVCPVGKRPYQECAKEEAYTVYAYDDELRGVSSSGGLFSLLANKILCQNGVIFGCSMTENCYGAYHTGVEDEWSLKKLRGSKYIQSNIENTFLEAKQALDNGRWVLYTGTPCQIAGFRSFLGGRQYDKLLTVDVICHGVPSPMIWEKYAQQLEREYNSKIVSVSFRDKTEGWRKYALVCEFQNGMQCRKTVIEDLYLRGFIENLFLRPSCQYCAAKGDAYWSDLTIGDCWSSAVTCPEIRNTRGVSIAIAHTAQGIHAMEELEHCYVEKENIEVALKSNPSYFEPVKHNTYREIIFREIMRKGVRKVLRQYCTCTISGKIRQKLAKIIK